MGWQKNLFEPTFFGVQNLFRTQTFFPPNFFFYLKFFGPKMCLVPKKFPTKIFFDHFFQTQNFFRPKIFIKSFQAKHFRLKSCSGYLTRNSLKPHPHKKICIVDSDWLIHSNVANPLGVQAIILPSTYVVSTVFSFRMQIPIWTF